MSLIVLFGLSGAGKNFVGNVIQEEFGYYFWDADEALTEDMKLAISQNEHFTQEMRDNYIKVVIDRISYLLQNQTNIVVSQALYREKNRRQLLTAFPDARFYWVKADNSILADRLEVMPEHINAKYRQLIENNFEVPVLNHEEIYNNANKESLMIQLASLFKKKLL